MCLSVSIENWNEVVLCKTVLGLLNEMGQHKNGKFVALLEVGPQTMRFCA